MSARQSETRCRMPPESWRGRLWTASSRPHQPQQLHRPVRDRPSGPCASSRSETAHSASVVFHGSKVGSWKTIPISARGCVIGVPPATILPSVTASRPAIIIRSVLLPQPLGPSRQTNSPFSMEKVAAVTASNAAGPLPNTLRTPWQLISGCMLRDLAILVVMAVLVTVRRVREAAVVTFGP